MKGVNKERLEQCKTISIKDYLQDTHPDLFRLSKNKDRLICINNSDYVVYDDHGYIFTKGIKYPRRDNIDVIQDLLGLSFIEAVEELEAWSNKSISTSDKTSNEEVDTSGFMIIPDHIDDVAPF